MSTPTTERALRQRHLARAERAYRRAVAACRAAGVEPDQAETVPTGLAARAASAVRLSARSIAELEGRSPDAAADARCARNAAAAAAVAAQAAHEAHANHVTDADHGSGTGESVAAALRAALAASRAAAELAGGQRPGRDEALLARADAAEEDARAAAERAGWVQAASRAAIFARRSP
ncbi:hypothetical protein [Streptomyces sp. NPDC059063]|uniref:hypothetical protein n=1 Tax=unclassified Streptomyces TaxID=2593676 RepID=UPI0036774DDC